jgi:uncharacterized membrane protein YphA (DoxX/SURF4 family)
MNNLIVFRFATIGVRIVLALVFLLSGVTKSISPLEFSDLIARYRIVPSVWNNLIAMGLAPLEMAVGVLVLSGICLRVGLLVMLGLLSIFIVSLLYAITCGHSIECGCFEGWSWLDARPPVALMRDCLFFVCAALLYVHYLWADSAEFFKSPANSQA